MGFSDGESSFIILSYLDKTKIVSYTFRFVIELHVDDLDALKFIQSKLKIGNEIAVYGNSCKFTVTHPKDIYKLISIFDKYNLNTSKYLDYLNFKKAFILYQERNKTIEDKQALIDQILDLKNGMNKSRTDFNFPADHKITITRPWLLGFIEGEGSFYLLRNEFEPAFSIAQTEQQLLVIEKIQEFFVNNLGFDQYSKYKLKCSSAIAINIKKGLNNSKSLAALVIKNTNVLNNYLIPYLDNMTFYTKKGKDFNDFKIICRAIYNGVHRIEEIKPLILELSYTMNNYRLSTNSDPKKVSSLSLQENIDKIIKTEPTIIHLGDGRQLDIFTKKAVNRRWTNCIYEIIKPTGEVLLAPTLDKAAAIIGVDFRTVRKHLEPEALYLEGRFVTIKGHKVKRIPVFCP